MKIDNERYVRRISFFHDFPVRHLMVVLRTYTIAAGSLKEFFQIAGFQKKVL